MASQPSSQHLASACHIGGFRETKTVEHHSSQARPRARSLGEDLLGGRGGVAGLGGGRAPSRGISRWYSMFDMDDVARGVGPWKFNSNPALAQKVSCQTLRVGVMLSPVNPFWPDG